MKKPTLEILHRYRKHLLEREQAALQDRWAEENTQKARILQLQTRVQETHEAKLKATSAAELCTLDDAAAYLHGRTTMAQRALSLARAAREEAVDRMLTCKKERDQVGMVIENDRRRWVREQDESERLQADDLATARYAMRAGNV
jgi:flagellar export protein FliJ